MNKDHAYPNGRTDNQLRVLEHLGMLAVDWYGETRDSIKDTVEQAATGPARSEERRDAAPAPGRVQEARRSLRRDARPRSPRAVVPARELLACHVEAGGGNARIELEFTTARDKMRLVAEKASHQTFDLRDPTLVVPGHPERSVLVHRVGLRGPGQMPPLASNRVDDRGLALLRDWVRGLK